MSTTPKLTMIGLYNHDDKLFDKMTLPAGIDKEEFIYAFLLQYGEFPVIYPAWDIMQFALGIWSKKWYHSIERIIYAMTEEYNPLHNFDRHEEYSDAEAKTGNTSESGTTSGTITNDQTVRTLNLTDTTNGTTSGTENGSTENTVSAYNADTYQPDNKSDTERTTGTTQSGTDTHTGTDTSVRNAETSGADSRTGTSAEDRTLQHTGHLYGNIGVTESTAMLQHEVDLRRETNIIDIVAEMLFKEVCIYTY